MNHCKLYHIKAYSKQKNQFNIFASNQLQYGRARNYFSNHGHGYQAYQVFSQVADVVNVIRPEHVVACVVYLTLTPHIVRVVAQ